MITAEDRLWAKVERGGPSECWPWTGTLTKGYGHIKVSGKLIYTHRLALSLATGVPLSDPRKALHRCDNPPCCNPTHLRWGTQAQNIQDAIERQRAKMPPRRQRRTHCTRGHEMPQRRYRMTCPTCRTEQAA